MDRGREVILMCSCEGTCASATRKRRASRKRAAARKARRCWSKKRFETRDEALAAAVKLQNHDRRRRKRYAYGDCGCGGWHVTSEPPRGT